MHFCTKTDNTHFLPAFCKNNIKSGFMIQMLSSGWLLMQNFCGCPQLRNKIKPKPVTQPQKMILNILCFLNWRSCTSFYTVTTNLRACIHTRASTRIVISNLMLFMNRGKTIKHHSSCSSSNKCVNQF